jgi:hypothetical protein
MNPSSADFDIPRVLVPQGLAVLMIGKMVGAASSCAVLL